MVLIWFTVEEAEALEVALEELRECGPEYKAFLLVLEQSDFPDEFLLSWE